jgi:hypothetical protein
VEMTRSLKKMSATMKKMLASPFNLELKYSLMPIPVRTI